MPFPFEAWARPGKDAFEFWISFFPTAPLFGVEWRFAEMLRPEMNPFIQAGATPVFMPFPDMRAAGAAAWPGEWATAASADERAARPEARATEAAAETVNEATRVAAEAGKAAVRTAEQAVNPVTSLAEPAAKDRAPRKTRSDGAAPADAAPRTSDIRRSPGKASATAAGMAGGGAAALSVAADGPKKGRAALEPATPKSATASVAVETAAPEVAAPGPEALDAAIAAGSRPEVLLDARPDEVDDLTTIKGIGPGLARQLNGLGVWRLEQIARMTGADLTWIDANLTSFKGRCFRDEWVRQAKARLGR